MIKNYNYSKNAKKVRGTSFVVVVVVIVQDSNINIINSWLNRETSCSDIMPRMTGKLVNLPQACDLWSTGRIMSFTNVIHPT